MHMCGGPLWASVCVCVYVYVQMIILFKYDNVILSYLQFLHNITMVINWKSFDRL